MSTLANPPAKGDYSLDVTRVRIVRNGTDEHPWMLDAYNPVTCDFTEDCWEFATFDEAVAAIPSFVSTVQSDIARTR